MPQVRKANPEKNCFLQTDKLYIDSKIFVYNEVLGQVVEHSESVRFDMFLLFELNARCLKVWGHDVKTWLYDDDGRRHWGLHANEQVAFFFFNIYLFCHF